MGERLGDVHDVALGVDAHFLVESADAAHPHDVPGLVQLRSRGFGGWLYHQLLEAVLLTVLAGMRTRDSLGAFARDGLRQIASPSRCQMPPTG